MQANCKALLAALLWLACTGAAGADLAEAGRVAKYFRQGIRSPAVRLATQVEVLRTPDVELDALGTPLERPISLSAPRTDLEKDVVRWYGEAARPQ